MCSSEQDNTHTHTHTKCSQNLRKQNEFEVCVSVEQVVLLQPDSLSALIKKYSFNPRNKP